MYQIPCKLGANHMRGMFMSGKHWTSEEDEILIYLNSKNLGPNQIYKSKKLPGRSYASILQRCIKLKLESIDKWTDKEIWIAYILYQKGLNIHEIADSLPKRSKAAVNAKLTRDALYYHRPPCEMPKDLIEKETVKLLKKSDRRKRC